MKRDDSIIVIDPEEFIRDLLGEYFGKLGYQVFPVADIPTALGLITSRAIPVALVDFGISSGRGLASIEQLIQVHPDLQVVVLTGCPTLDSVIGAFRVGVFDLVIKPFRLEDLRRIVEKAMARACAQAVKADLRRRVGELEDIIRRHGLTPPINERHVAEPHETVREASE